ncbi:MAG: nicotinate phosphoribosyltransferase [Chloroflexi bacterium]|nr:nicotinate phosphoribosyltransferase [Chloroflexota bacterium]|tara:strand:+ start:77445 stop:78443 length:999 start_codon:yes stop_codon:yes gene_type:complete
MTTPEFEINRNILSGNTADYEIIRTGEILREEKINPDVVVDFTFHDDGILCGITEVRTLLNLVLPEKTGQAFSLEEGQEVKSGEVVLQIKSSYASFSTYQTAISGILASCSGWATAAKECFDAADGVPVIGNPARYVHPEVVGMADFSAAVGGCSSTTTMAGHYLHNLTPSGTMNHSFVLLMGDSLRAMNAFDKHMDLDIPRVALVDTFSDEIVESIKIGHSMKGRLRGIRIDTPKSRGGVTPELVKEIKSRLDNEKLGYLDVIISGGMNPERIRQFVQSKAPVGTFVVGHYIASGKPKIVSADIKSIDGINVGKRGIIPGPASNEGFKQIH